MAEGKVSEACPKFAESYRLDPATGTLLNLAHCHESQGKLATAWLEFSRALPLARRDGRDDRVRFAQERLAIIEPKLSYLTVVAPPEPSDLEVHVDDAALPPAAIGVPTPVDAGDHMIVARAPGRKPYSERVHVGDDAKKVTVTIPALEAISAVEPMPLVVPRSREIPNSVYVAGGVTLALTAAAGVTAYVYMHNRAEDGEAQSPSDFERNRRWGAVNLGFDVAALGAGAVTAYLYWTRDLAPNRAATFVPWVGRGAAGVGWYGSL
jgi:hypothetical protein